MLSYKLGTEVYIPYTMDIPQLDCDRTVNIGLCFSSPKKCWEEEEEENATVILK